MKLRFSVVLIAALSAACNSTPSNQNNPGPVTANRAGDISNSPAPPPASNSAPISGEKVAAHEDVRFTSGGFSQGWEWIDPTTGSEPIPFENTGTGLKFTIPTGRDLYGVNRSAPRLVKGVEGDFQFETKLKLDPKEDYQGAGILVYAGPERYLRFERGFGGVGGGTNGLRLDVREGANYRALTTPEDAPTEAPSVELKLLRTGNTFTAFWRLNEESEWKEVGQYESGYPAAVQVGIIACNTGKPISVEFSGVRLAPAP